jgi:DNA-binding GntR family transcriptional regulator
MLKDLQDLPRNEDWDRSARAADSRLHYMIADGSGNPRLAHEIKRYLSLFRSMRNIAHVRDSWNNYQRSDDVPDHLRIVEALVRNNPDKAAAAMDQHIRTITKVLLETVFVRPDPKGPGNELVMIDGRTRR